MPTAAHFIYIPGVLLVGIVIGWILGSRAAADAYAAKLEDRSREQRLDGATSKYAAVRRGSMGVDCPSRSRRIGPPRFLD